MITYYYNYWKFVICKRYPENYNLFIWMLIRSEIRRPNQEEELYETVTSMEY